MINKETDSTDKCYLTYSDELNGGGYLICTYNHKAGEKCLMDERNYRFRQKIDKTCP